MQKYTAEKILTLLNNPMTLITYPYTGYKQSHDILKFRAIKSESSISETYFINQ